MNLKPRAEPNGSVDCDARRTGRDGRQHADFNLNLRHAIDHHEAGHAMVALLLGYRVKFIKIDDRTGWCVYHDPQPEHEPRVTIAGIVAQERFFPGAFPISEGDIKLLRRLFANDATLLPRAIYDAAYLVDAHWPAIRRIARNVTAVAGRLVKRNSH